MNIDYSDRKQRPKKAEKQTENNLFAKAQQNHNDIIINNLLTQIPAAPPKRAQNFLHTVQ
jgi:hypothetical protein